MSVLDGLCNIDNSCLFYVLDNVKTRKLIELFCSISILIKGWSQDLCVDFTASCNWPPDWEDQIDSAFLNRMSKILTNATGRNDLFKDVTLGKEDKKAGDAREETERRP